MRRQGWRDQSGSVLVWVMVIGLFAVGALGAVTRLLPAGTHLAEQDKDTTYALIAAESGVNFVAHYLRENPGATPDQLNQALRNADPGLQIGDFDIAGDGEFVYVRARSGNATRNLRAKLPEERTPPEPPINLTNAIFATYDGGHKGDRAVNLSPTPSINGSVGTNSSAMGAFHVGGHHTITGSIFLGPGSRADTIEHPDWLTIHAPVEELPERLVFPLPKFPSAVGQLPWRGSVTLTSNISPMTIDESGAYESINVGGGWELRFDTSTVGDIFIQAKRFKIQGNAKVHIDGPGRVFIHVTDELVLADKEFNAFRDGPGTYGDPNQLVIYYTGDRKLTIASNFRLAAVLYVEHADASIGGSAGFRGGLFSGGTSVSLSGGSNMENTLIYAPEADVTLSGSGISGAVVGRRISMSGGAVSHAAIDFGVLPLDFGHDFGHDDEYNPAEDGLVWHVCWDDMGCDARSFEGFD